MLSMAIAWLTTNPKRLRLVGYGAAILVAVALFASLIAKARHEQHLADMRAAAEAQAAALRRDAAAKEIAAQQRRADDAASAALQKDLRAAYAQTPDSAPSGVRLALACRRLRGTAQARDPKFSELCGPDH